MLDFLNNLDSIPIFLASIALLNALSRLFIVIGDNLNSNSKGKIFNVIGKSLSLFGLLLEKIIGKGHSSTSK